MAIQAWRAALSLRAQRLVNAVPGASLVRYRIVAVPLPAMPARARPSFQAGEIPGDEAVASGLAGADAAAWRLAQGMTCVGVRQRDALVGVTWLTTAPFDEDEAWLTFAPPPGAAWDTGMAIAPAARGGPAFAMLWAATRDWLAARGLAWSVSRIASYNLGSRRAHARLGGVEVGAVTALRLGGRALAAGARPMCAHVGRVRPVVHPALPR